MIDCSRLGRLVYLVTALFIAAGVFGCATTRSTTPSGPPPQAAARTEKTVAPGPVQRPAYQGSVMAAYYPSPDKIDFCGEPVPLGQEDVRERFDKEFTLVVYNHAQVYRWLKRKGRYFPWIEERLRRLNLPEDLKYVAIAESEPPLNTPEKKKSADMRYDFAVSPDGAFQYLADLYRSFNSWPLVLAAYNYSEKRIMDESRAQGARDFYHMMLPQETERYVFRILAIKAVLSDPARYGYELPKGAGYP
ncbi:MAG: transglycosylase SLT domain-containing protein [Desulfobacteraceae bacterium]|nr:transglycosylase SLT domain-containing protein [Desulfobacteraceae bacterium]